MISEHKSHSPIWFKLRHKVNIDKPLLNTFTPNRMVFGWVNIKRVIMIHMTNKLINMAIIHGSSRTVIRNSMNDKHQLPPWPPVG
ncbi:hypothetical protein CJ20_126 [Escherichia phage CJ20]|nr:hypothetical protein CJ20_126 [Escherichia phage CJ20]